MTNNAPNLVGPAMIQKFVADIPMVSKLKLMKFANLKSSDISLDVLREIAQTVGIKAADSSLEKAAALIRADDPDSMADWLGTGENVTRLMTTLFTPGGSSQLVDQDSVEGNDDPVIVCPLCHGCFHST